MEQEKPKSNLLVELAKRKAQARAEGKSGILGKDLAARQSKRLQNQSYTWRGGRNGQGKP